MFGRCYSQVGQERGLGVPYCDKLAVAVQPDGLACGCHVLPLQFLLERDGSPGDPKFLEGVKFE